MSGKCLFLSMLNVLHVVQMYIDVLSKPPTVHSLFLLKWSSYKVECFPGFRTMYANQFNINTFQSLVRLYFLYCEVSHTVLNIMWIIFKKFVTSQAHIENINCISVSFVYILVCFLDLKSGFHTIWIHKLRIVAKRLASNSRKQFLSCC